MRYYCDQCGNEFVEGDLITITEYGHYLHEYCEDDYLNDIRNLWDSTTYEELTEDDEEFEEDLTEITTDEGDDE